LATGTPTLGLGVTINTSGLNISGVATAGIVSATTLYGDGSNLTGIALTIAPLNYNPAVFSQASHLTKASGIGLTFNQGVKAGSGNVTLSLANAGVAGTVVENFGVGNSVTYSNGDSILITPTADLSVGQNYHLSYPSGAFTNIGGDVSYVGTAYTFQAKSYSYQIWTAGTNEYAGGLGQNNYTQYSSPVQIPGTTWVSGEGTHNATFSIKSDGTLWAWGRNAQGQLGQNTLTYHSSPVQIPGTTWSRVRYAGTAAAVLATKTDNTLWAWGYNAYGQLGQNGPTNTDRSSPIQIPGTTWHTEKFDMGHNKAFATKTDGTLWAWGRNNWGQLGLNQAPAQLAACSSPIQIPGTTWSNIQDAYGHTNATKTDGTLWAWGYQGYGELGQNNTTVYSSPVQIPGTTWDKIGSSLYASSATKTDGTLWTWGHNDHGVLGQNSTVQYSSPVQIPGTTWSNVQFNDVRCGFGIKTDGTLWSWGRNQYGQLGQNHTASISSPTQIPGTDWNWIGSGGISGVLMGKRV